jgi:transcriptional regulator with XRE-family HTH domain
MRYSYLQIEKHIADKITFLCEKRDISKYRLSQLSGISQSSLGRVMEQETLPSLITLEKICAALGVTLSQFF